MALLEVKGLTKDFGGLTAVDNLDFDINGGEIVGLIGPNGAGKTTVFNLISGFSHPTSGTIIFKGHKISHSKPHVIAALGLVRTFQEITLFKKQTVIENVVMGHYLQRRRSLLASVLGIRPARIEEEEIRQRAREVLERTGLARFENALAGSLPFGHQRALGVAIGLSVNPFLMLLDEPVTGMNAEEAETMMDLIRDVCDQGITILLVEHHMKAALGLCSRVIVLNFGKKIAEDVPQRIIENKDVIETYLGTEEIE